MSSHPRLSGLEAAVIPSRILDYECPWNKNGFILLSFCRWIKHDPVRARFLIGLETKNEGGAHPA